LQSGALERAILAIEQLPEQSLVFQHRRMACNGSRQRPQG